MNILKNIQEALRDLDFIEITREEKSKLRSEFNTSYSPNAYAVNWEEGLIMLVLTVSGFGSFEYYYGMEYARDDIQMKLQYDKDMIVGYDINCTRVQNLINKINPDIEF